MGGGKQRASAGWSQGDTSPLRIEPDIETAHINGSDNWSKWGMISE